MASKVRFLADGAGGDRGNLLPWVIAVMVYLSGLALAGGLAVHGAVANWSGDMTGRLTVQIVNGDTAARDRQATAALELLRKTDGVASARRLGDPELQALLEPWLGSGAVGAELPVPALLDVVLKDGAAVNLSLLGGRLKKVAPDASLDDHEQWLGRLHDLARMVEVTAVAIVVLVTLATIAIVIFGTQAGLATHRATIETLHTIGAEDALIARAFQDRFLKLGFQGGVGGLVMAAATIFAGQYILTKLGAGILSHGTLRWFEFSALAVLPFAAAAIAMLTARFTVLRALARMV